MVITGKFIPSVAAAAQTNTGKNGTGQREDDEGGGYDDADEHTYPIVVADKKATPD